MSALDDHIASGNARDLWYRQLDHERALRNRGWQIDENGMCANPSHATSKAHVALDAAVRHHHPDTDCLFHGWPQPCGPCTQRTR